MKRILFVGLTTLAACSQPRSVSYFEALPEETARVVQACRAGSHPGRECENALVAEAAIKAKAREDLFRRGFE